MAISKYPLTEPGNKIIWAARVCRPAPHRGELDGKNNRFDIICRHRGCQPYDAPNEVLTFPAYPNIPTPPIHQLPWAGTGGPHAAIFVICNHICMRPHSAFAAVCGNC